MAVSRCGSAQGKTGQSLVIGEAPTPVSGPRDGLVCVHGVGVSHTVLHLSDGVMALLRLADAWESWPILELFALEDADRAHVHVRENRALCGAVLTPS